MSKGRIPKILRSSLMILHESLQEKDFQRFYIQFDTFIEDLDTYNKDGPWPPLEYSHVRIKDALKNYIMRLFDTKPRLSIQQYYREIVYFLNRYSRNQHSQKTHNTDMIARLTDIIAELKELKRLLGNALDLFFFIVFTHEGCTVINNNLYPLEKNRTEVTAEQSNGGYPYV